MFNYMPDLLQGLNTTLILTASSLLLALVFSLLFTYCLALNNKIASKLIHAYITLFTGTPLLIQLFLIYYGPGQFKFLTEIPLLWEVISNPTFCAILTLVLNSTAYTTVLLYGALKTIPEGQWQSCAALGMSKHNTLAILLPYAFKRALSSYSNEVIIICKSTSLVSVITLMDMMGYARKIVGNNYDVMVIVQAGMIYLCINAVLTLIMRLIERRALRFEKRN